MTLQDRAREAAEWVPDDDLGSIQRGIRVDSLARVIHSAIQSAVEESERAFVLACNENGVTPVEAAQLPKLFRWQKESLAAFRDKFKAASNCEALDAISTLTQQNLELTREKEHFEFAKNPVTCSKGHRFYASVNHPAKSEREWECPNCLAEQVRNQSKVLKQLPTFEQYKEMQSYLSALRLKVKRMEECLKEVASAKPAQGMQPGSGAHMRYVIFGRTVDEAKEALSSTPDCGEGV